MSFNYIFSLQIKTIPHFIWLQSSLKIRKKTIQIHRTREDKRQLLDKKTQNISLKDAIKKKKSLITKKNITILQITINLIRGLWCFSAWLNATRFSFFLLLLLLYIFFPYFYFRLYSVMPIKRVHLRCHCSVLWALKHWCLPLLEV